MLLPEYDSKEHAEAILKELYKYIFKVELSAWITDESKWPKNKCQMPGHRQPKSNGKKCQEITKQFLGTNGLFNKTSE
ncbi:MAG: hypothetical protein MUO88_14580 [Desulfobacterales bacterium]|jgi:hypothetical protein|nr:hypothetical protein [Desulfobacterales bacterium]